MIVPVSVTAPWIIGMSLRIKSQLRDALIIRLRAKGDLESLSDSELIFRSGRLDSLDAVEVVTDIEASYGIDLSTADYMEMSLEQMTDLVSSRAPPSVA
jgi:acyl carrier protein